MKAKEYYMGFDLGTGSVGWAITDPAYHLLKVNRKPTWGSVLFDTSDGAAERRGHRCARRRYRREKERLELLRELFEEEVCKVDQGFFLRLKESRFVPEDKLDAEGNCPELPYTLFVDKDYTDDQYHAEFPTIYHLRCALMKEPKPFDVRLVYLAIAHMLKSRGHFLTNMGTDEISLDFNELYMGLVNTWNDLMDEELQIGFTSEEAIELARETLKDYRMTKKDKQLRLIQVLGITQKTHKDLITLITGGSVGFSRLFGKEEYAELEEKKISFDDASYEEKEAIYAACLGDDFEIISKAKAIYDWMVLLGILKGDESGFLSETKVRDYETHQKDLHILKEAILQDGIGTEEERRKLYRRTFGVPAKGVNNYSAYIGMAKFKGKKVSWDGKKCSKADFYGFVKSDVLKKIKDGERKAYITEAIELELFMPKARDKSNSVVPYQIHAKELKIILRNAENYLPFLKERDEKGYSVSDKIMMLLSFRIPYYVGPLNPYHEHAWVERKEAGRVTPWNFSDKVDVEASAEKFILRMTSKCTYLKREDVLPASSLLYEKYLVLNELNNLRINSEYLDVELKQRIYHNLYERKAKVTLKKLVDYLKREEPGYAAIKKEDISGVDGELKAALKSYHAFKREFTDCPLTEQQKEDIIKDMTLFGAEPELLLRRLNAKYPGYENQMKALTKSLSCQDWGKLSQKLLSGIAIEVPGLGMVGTVIQQMWTTQNNFMQVIAVAESPFRALIEQENGSNQLQGVTYEDIDELYVSPSVKRAIWKSVQVLEEAKKAMGGYPARVFVEMAREHEDSKRSVTRKDTLLGLYKSAKVDTELWNRLQEQSNDSLRKDALYLYFTQMGIDAYTGEKIDFDKLSEKYNEDHIYPQAKTADDSLSNRVLVEKVKNEEKKDKYPLDNEIQTKMHVTWSMWLKKKLISQEKYNRLVRTTELSNEELAGFINRQLVETQQSTKEFVYILKRILPEETEIVYTKARNVSRFRQRYDILKVRDLNDLHHAKDAYLNIVVGNVYHVKFTKSVFRFLEQNGSGNTYSLNKMFDWDVKDGNKVIWNMERDMPLVKKTLSSDKVLVSRQSYERKGGLFDINPLKKGKGQVALKDNSSDTRLADINRYGGYGSATISYFVWIEGEDKKGRTQKIIAPVPLYLSRILESDVDKATEYFADMWKISNVKIIRKIPMQTLIVYDGFKARITGKSEKQLILNNASQFITTSGFAKQIKEIGKFIEDCKVKKDAEINDKSGLTSESMTELYDSLMDKLENTIYKVPYGNYAELMKSGRELFVELSDEAKARQLFELLKLFQCTPEMPNTELIGGSKTPGRIRIGMNVTKRSGLAIIHQSVTGLYERIERIVE